MQADLVSFKLAVQQETSSGLSFVDEGQADRVRELPAPRFANPPAKYSPRWETRGHFLTLYPPLHKKKWAFERLVFSRGGLRQCCNTHSKPPKDTKPPRLRRCFATKLIHYLLDLNLQLLKPRPLLQVCKRGVVERKRSGLEWLFHLLVVIEEQNVQLR